MRSEKKNPSPRTTCHEEEGESQDRWKVDGGGEIAYAVAVEGRWSVQNGGGPVRAMEVREGRKGEMRTEAVTTRGLRRKVIRGRQERETYPTPCDKMATPGMLLEVLVLRCCGEMR
jgi:hypothetical protein